MPIQNIQDTFYSFDRDYSKIPLVNLPIRYIEPQFGKVLFVDDVNAIKVYTNSQDIIKFYPDFNNTSPSGLAATNFVDNYRYFFDFGDGTTSPDLTASHYYETPGTYEVTLVCVDSATNFYKSTTVAKVCAVDVIPDALYLSYAHGDANSTSSIANSAFASEFKNPIFVTRFNSYQSYPAVSATGYTIRLSVSGNSSPIMKSDEYYSDTNAHLRKYAAFAQDINGKFTIVDTVSTTMQKIYGVRQRVSPSLPDWFLMSEPEVGSIFLGTSGVGSFYYYED